jgi:transposase
MQPISNDKRADIIKAKQRNESVETIKEWFNISESSISRIWNKFLKTGSYLPIPYVGRKSDITPAQDEQIRLKIKENCDIRLEDLISELSLELTISGLSRHLKKMGISLKKNTPPQRTKARRCCHRKAKMARKPATAKHVQFAFSR